MLDDDPELFLATADMRAWVDAGNDQDEDDCPGCGVTGARLCSRDDCWWRV